MRVTLADIAREVGVSKSAVAQVLRSDPSCRVASDTRQRILDTAHALGYLHNYYAQTLSSGKTRLVGILTATIQPEVLTRKWMAIEANIRSRGYRTLLRCSGFDPDYELSVLNEFFQNMVEGIIVLSDIGDEASDALRLLIERRIPVLRLDPFKDMPTDCVTVDRAFGAYLATKHLLDLGHRRIAFMGVQAGLHPSVYHRIPGYCQALREYGIEPEDSLLLSISGEPTYEVGYESAREMLARRVDATALFCCNDQVAIGSMKALHEAGIRIPQDLAIIGFDNISASEYAPVPLTTIAQPVEEIGRLAVEMLFNRMSAPEDSRPPQTLCLQPRLIARESTIG